MQNQNPNWWNNLDNKWKKLVYLNYRLSKEDDFWRISTFLDDSYGLEYIMCKIFKLESDNPCDDLVKLDSYVNNQILKIDESFAQGMLLIEELCLQGVNTLKPLEYFPKLKLVYLDHCKTHDINTLNNLNKLRFYETPEYPTNIPSFYHDTDAFSENVNIIKNPFVEVQKYFEK